MGSCPHTTIIKFGRKLVGGVYWKLVKKFARQLTNYLDYFIIIFYMMGMVAIGFWFSKRHGDFEDFFLIDILFVG